VRILSLRCNISRLLAVCVLPVLIQTIAFGAEQQLILEQGVDGYEGMEDTTIFGESENSGGGTDGIFAGTTAQLNLRRALLRADLTSINPGTTVLSATLRLTVDRSGGNQGDSAFTLHRLLALWGEGTVVGPIAGGFGGDADLGDATWSANFFGSSAWDTAGGDFVLSASAEALAGQSSDIVEWTSAELAADVQAWIDDPASNFGWLIKSGQEGSQQVVKRFHSTEASSNRPQLIVVIDVPPSEDADINVDGNFDAVDVQLVINAALDIDIGGLDADVNDDAAVDAVDVQSVINAVLEL
jgi:hypothetical protein